MTVKEELTMIFEQNVKHYDETEANMILQLLYFINAKHKQANRTSLDETRTAITQARQRQTKKYTTVAEMRAGILNEIDN
ncbi:hypothetical protein I4Q36_07580 [Tuanshanicoccus lijuaniae]|uniref:hypothetical protein n=1 Tax=Aerococcaceae bacterium zg-1292 TaxID=2774330 RepID=UPI001938B81D|nr:hypothetical protein [Aerococcaceae bacterium zg-1292]MBF6978720.1 hypothetical protein [Aerococcaceae bacterium zg-BR22]MBS4456846.1 hypothetical protein [Aerococcaceae bacterium zg-A91]MBS4458676.1 hypothetical protein [Aerococcaceae bacterium zg-BR33]QQA36653.1 hypothetical protein I4Q36_07580 [Aerococcaceae bacterium zg-1292]